MEVGDWARVHNHARQNGQADHRRDRRHRVSPAHANPRDPIPSHPELHTQCRGACAQCARLRRRGHSGGSTESAVVVVRGGNGSGLVASPLGCFAGMMRRQGWCPRVGPSRCKHKLTQHDREGAGMIPTPAPTPTSSRASRTSSPTWTPAPGCCVGVARIAQRGRFTLSLSLGTRVFVASRRRALACSRSPRRATPRRGGATPQSCVMSSSVACCATLSIVCLVSRRLSPLRRRRFGGGAAVIVILLAIVGGIVVFILRKRKAHAAAVAGNTADGNVEMQGGAAGGAATDAGKV